MGPAVFVDTNVRGTVTLLEAAPHIVPNEDGPWLSRRLAGKSSALPTEPERRLYPIEVT